MAQASVEDRPLEHQEKENKVMGVRRAKKIGIYLGLVAILTGFCVLLLQPLLKDCVSVLATGRGRVDYVAVAAGETGEIFALGRDGDAFVIAQGDQYGARVSQWFFQSDQIPASSRVAAFYPDTRDVFYLGVYLADESGNVSDLALFRLSEKGKSAELLLKEPLAGTSVPERMAGAVLSSFSKVSGETRCTLIKGSEVIVYGLPLGEAGVQIRATEKVTGAKAALALMDERVAAAGEKGLSLSGESAAFPRNGQIISGFRQAGAGIYYIDRASLEVFYTDLTNPDRFQSAMSLEKSGYDLNGATDIALTREGNALILLHGDTLLIDRGSAVTDLTSMLYRPAAQCALILAGLALAVAAVAFVLWYVICEWRALQIPLLLRWGVALVAIGVLAAAGVLGLMVEPYRQDAAARQVYDLSRSATALVLQQTAMDDPALPARLADSIAVAKTAGYDVAVSVYEKGSDNVWRLRASNTGASSGTRAELTADFDRETALLAQQQPMEIALNRDGRPRFCRYLYQDGLLLTVSVGGGALMETSAQLMEQVRLGVFAGVGLLLVLSLFALSGVSFGLRRIIAGVESLAAGKTDVKIRLNSGDEMEGLAVAVNSLAQTMGELEVRQRELAKSYMRFVPERVMALLGKKSLAEVDKGTFASRKVLAMMIWFGFPRETYEKSGKELFDNINEIIERTASIVAQKGGTVFNFAYDGYDAVFPVDPALAVSTAVTVQQEVLAINREREVDGRPPVTLRIALDEGNMMIGVVGDETQMEPTAISSSFSVARQLIALCNLLDANILCTEAVAAGAKDYGIRYMGKCVDGREAIRTYEIYDGDPYDVRRVKQLTGKRFSEGVYALYSRDFAAAKRIFLDMVHRNTGDGGARYYLYLADQLEKNPDREISLSAR